jgi:hypothetical protein
MKDEACARASPLNIQLLRTSGVVTPSSCTAAAPDRELLKQLNFVSEFRRACA